MKDYTVSIKHYLNTNGKPSVIGGENYYPIFLLITAKRKTTRFKSLMFTELYTEQMYNDIMTSTDDEDKNAIQNELTAVERIARLTIDELNEFNTAFFVAYVNFSNNLDIWKANAETIGSEYDTINNYNAFDSSFFGVAVDHIYTDLQDFKELKRSITLFEFLNFECQNFIKDKLKDTKLKYSISEVLKDINKLHFYNSIEYFTYFVKGSKRTQDLTEKYYTIFDNYRYIIADYLVKKYQP